MDGVTGILSWSNQYDNKFSYVPDPIYFPFAGDQYVIDSSYLLNIQVLQYHQR